MEFLQRHLPRVYQAVQNALEYLSAVTTQIFGPPQNAPRRPHPSNAPLGINASEIQEVSESPRSATGGSGTVGMQGEGLLLPSEEAVEATEGSLEQNEASPAEDYSMKCPGPPGEPEHKNQETDLQNTKSKGRTQSDPKYPAVNEEEVPPKELNIPTEKDRVAGALERPDTSKHHSACEEGDQEISTQKCQYGMMSDLEGIDDLEYPDTSKHQENSACEEDLNGDLERVCMEDSSILKENSGDQEISIQKCQYGMGSDLEQADDLEDPDDLEEPDISKHQENSACEEDLNGDLERVCMEDSSILKENSGDQETLTQKCQYGMGSDLEQADAKKIGITFNQHTVSEGKNLSSECIVTEDGVPSSSDIQSGTKDDEGLTKMTILEDQLQENVLTPESCEGVSLPESYTDDIILQPEDTLESDQEVAHVVAQSRSVELASKVKSPDYNDEEDWNLMSISRVKTDVAQNEGDLYLAGQSDDEEDINQPEKMEDINHCEIPLAGQSAQIQEDIKKSEQSFSLEENSTGTQEELVDISSTDTGKALGEVDQPLVNLSLEGDPILWDSRSPNPSELESPGESVLWTEDDRPFTKLDKLEESWFLETDVQHSEDGAEELTIKGGQPRSRIFEKGKTLEIMEGGDEEHKDWHEESSSSSQHGDPEEGPEGSTRKTDLTPVLSSTTETDRGKYEELLPPPADSVHYQTSYTESLMPPSDHSPDKLEEEDRSRKQDPPCELDEASSSYDPLIRQDESESGGFEGTLWYDDCEIIHTKLEELLESDWPRQVGVPDGIQEEALDRSDVELSLAFQNGEGTREDETLNYQDLQPEDETENEDETNGERSVVIIPRNASLRQEMEVDLELERSPLAEDMCLGTSDTAEDQRTQTKAGDFPEEGIGYPSESGLEPDVDGEPQRIEERFEHHSVPPEPELPVNAENGTLEETGFSGGRVERNEDKATDEMKGDCRESVCVSLTEEEEEEEEEPLYIEVLPAYKDTEGDEGRSDNEEQMIESDDNLTSQNKYADSSEVKNEGEGMECEKEVYPPQRESIEDVAPREQTGPQDTEDDNKEGLLSEVDGGEKEETSKDTSEFESARTPSPTQVETHENFRHTEIFHGDSNSRVTLEDTDQAETREERGGEGEDLLAENVLTESCSTQDVQEIPISDSGTIDGDLSDVGSQSRGTQEDNRDLPGYSDHDTLQPNEEGLHSCGESDLPTETQDRNDLQEEQPQEEGSHLPTEEDTTSQASNKGDGLGEVNISMEEGGKEVDVLPDTESILSDDTFIDDVRPDELSVPLEDGSLVEQNRSMAEAHEAHRDVDLTPAIDSETSKQSVSETVEERDFPEEVQPTARPEGSEEVETPEEEEEDSPASGQLGKVTDFSPTTASTPEEESPEPDNNMSATSGILVTSDNGGPAAQTIRDLEEGPPSSDKPLTSGGGELIAAPANEELLQSSQTPCHGDTSEDQKRLAAHDLRPAEGRSEAGMYKDLTPTGDEDETDMNLFPHSALDLSAQKSRVQLRRKISIRRRHGLRQSLPDPPGDVQPAPRPFSVGLPGILGKPPVAVPPPRQEVAPTPTDEPKEERGPAGELAVKPKKVPKHAGFGVPHPMMMQELQARLHKKKPKE